MKRGAVKDGEGRGNPWGLHLRHHGYKRGESESIMGAQCERSDLSDAAVVSMHC